MFAGIRTFGGGAYTAGIQACGVIACYNSGFDFKPGNWLFTIHFDPNQILNIQFVCPNKNFELCLY